MTKLGQTNWNILELMTEQGLSYWKLPRGYSWQTKVGHNSMKVNKVESQNYELTQHIYSLILDFLPSTNCKLSGSFAGNISDVKARMMDGWVGKDEDCWESGTNQRWVQFAIMVFLRGSPDSDFCNQSNPPRLKSIFLMKFQLSIIKT